MASRFFRAVVVQSFSGVQLFVTSWTVARQASPSISQSLLKLMSIESVMPSNHLILFFCLQSFLAIGPFPVSWLFASGSPSTGASASAPVLPMNIQNWFLLALTGLISSWSKGLSRGFSNTTVQKHQFFGAQLSLWSNSHIHTWLTCVVACIRTSFLFKSKYYFIVCVYHISSFITRHMVCCCSLAIVNNAAMNLSVWFQFYYLLLLTSVLFFIWFLRNLILILL